MSEKQVLEIPFDNVNQRQCYEIIGCAGEVVANAFAAGVPTLDVKVGSRRDGGNGIEEFFLGLEDKTCNGVSLRTEALGDITAGRPPAEFIPFKQTLWPLTLGKQPPTVDQVLFPVIDRIPFYVQMASPGQYTLEIAPTASYFLLRNWISNMFGLILVRGGLQQWFGICKAEEQGQPRRYFLMCSRVPQLGVKDIDSITKVESTYKPNWMLGDVLSGAHKDESLKLKSEDV